MRYKLTLVTFLLLICCFSLSAQVTGSLGDPVVQEDFGSGSNPHYPNTTYPRIGGSCPNDGYYALVQSESGCHDTWHNVLKDHTGNDGYMMVVNASASPGEFYSQQTPPLLCGGTTYELSAFVKNLVLPAFANVHEKPNLTFRIERLDGGLIDTYDTGPIYETAGDDDWQRIAKVFTLPLDANAVVVKIINNAPGGMGNDLILDDIAFRAYGPVVQAGFGGDITATQSGQCVGTAKSYTITSPGSADASLKYQWQEQVNGGGWQDLPGEQSTSLARSFPADKPVGTYEYRLGAASASNINSLNCRVYSNVVTIKVGAYPTPAVIPPVSVCEGEPIVLTADGGATYKWTGPGISGTDSHNPLVIPVAATTDAGLYRVEVISDVNCSTFRDVNVTVNLKPVVTVNSVDPVCKGEDTQLLATVTGAGSYSYNWLPAEGLSDAHSASPFASPGFSTLYTVTVTNTATQCSENRQVQVNVIQPPVADAGANKIIFEGQSVQLGGNSSTANVLSYSWSPEIYLNNPHSPTPVANPPFDVNYLLTITPTSGCPVVSDDVFVRVYQKVIVPTSFTPNNDGINDLWNIRALETYPESVISVYTRDGKQVFQSRGYAKAWDGNLNGSLLPAGTYYYVIDLKIGTPRLSGWVLIIR